MHKFVVVILFSVLIWSCAFFSTQEDESEYQIEDLKIKLNIKKITLANGLRALLVEDHRLPIVSYFTFYDVGGRYESVGATGATHFLEHLMFKGAKKYGPGEFDKIISGNGGQNNAYTTFDSTVYYENFPSKITEQVIDLESDRMANLQFGSEPFEKERSVVLEERKMRYENNPRGKIYLKMMQTFFKGTPYGLSVIGEDADVRALTRENIESFFKRFYVPNNAVIVVVGDINPKKVHKWIKKYYGSIPKAENLEQIKKEMDVAQRFINKPTFSDIHLKGETATRIFMLAYQGERKGTRKAYIHDYLASMIGNGQSSYFFQELVRGKKSLLSDIGVSNYNLRNNGVFFISGQMLGKTNYRSFKRKFTKVAKNSCEKAITKRNLFKTKNRLLVNYYAALESNAGIASMLGESEHFFKDYSYYEKELEIYNSITLAEVRSACHDLFDSGKGLYLTIGKK